MVEWIKKRDNLISNLLYGFLWNLKRIAFFFVNIWDFKFDFPLPPKKLKHRLLLPSFWSTMFNIYMVRKRAAKEYNHDVKDMWASKQFKLDGYEKWLAKIFNSQYGSVIDNHAFEVISSKDTKTIFEAGCGSGGAAACLLLRVLDQRFPSGDIQAEANSIEYTGIDLNEERINVANTFLPILFSHYSNKVKFNFKSGDLSKLDFKDKYFDYSFVPSVLERIDNENIIKVVGEISRITKNGIFVVDVADKYPMGTPRTHLEQEKIFKKFGFILKWHKYVKTNTKMKNQCELHAFFERVS